MTDIINNSFSVNNHISISNIVNKIPYFFMHFNPIKNYKSLNNKFKIIPQSKSNIINSEIKYKLITYNNEEYDTFIMTSNNFLKSVYHLFFSLHILNNSNISFIINNHSIISYNNTNNMPLLMDFTYSINLSLINFNYLIMCFPISLLKKKYISLDVFIITFLTHNKIEIVSISDVEIIIDQFLLSRENKNKTRITDIVKYFVNYSSVQIIKYLFQFRLTWSYYSLCYYFINNHYEFLSNNELLVPFYIFINSDFKDRNNNELLNIIHDKLFYIK